MASGHLLDPSTLARIKNLPLLSKKIIAGTMSGLQHSHQKGAGLEFSQYRNYEQGDDPRLIDWKLYARTDRYFVREALRESLVDVWFIIDCSASMNQCSDSITDWTRLDYARHLTATLASVVCKHGDAPGLIGLNDNGFTFLPAMRGARHLEALLVQLEQLTAKGCWPDAEKFAVIWEHLQRPSLIVLISDGLQKENELEQLVAKLSAAGREIINFQLLTDAEIHFNYRGNSAFRDPESGKILQINSSTARKDYLQNFQSYLDVFKNSLLRLGVDHWQTTIEQPMDDLLHQFLKHRLNGNLSK